MIVHIFLVSARTHSISRYIHIQTLYVHKRNVLRFLQHGTYHVVVRGGSHFCQSPKGGGSGVFLLKRKRGQHFFREKIPKFPSPPPPRKNVPSLKLVHVPFLANFRVRTLLFACLQLTPRGDYFFCILAREAEVPKCSTNFVSYFWSITSSSHFSNPEPFKKNQSRFCPSPTL